MNQTFSNAKPTGYASRLTFFLLSALSLFLSGGRGNRISLVLAIRYSNYTLYSITSESAVFEVEKPVIVFHLAAQRQPGLAEIKIRETVTTSLLACKHVIQLCEEYGVEHCIFSSTGKTSRYFTTRVYAASKKFAEWQFAAISSRRRCHLRDGSLYSYVGK